MATRTAGAKVVLDGETEYKQALTSLNNGNRVLASEMKKLQAEYKGNSDSVEFLTKKGDLLNRQLLDQKEKIDVMRQALEHAAKKYGEGSDEAMKWQAKLNEAEAAQYDLEHAIEENNQAIDNQGNTWGKVGGIMEEIAGKMGIKIPGEAKKALSGMQGLSAGTVAAMTAAAAAIAALVKAVSELHEMTLETAADVDELVTNSMKSGISTKTLQEMKYAENLIDVSVDTISGSLTKLTTNMAAANEGSEAMALISSALTNALSIMPPLTSSFSFSLANSVTALAAEATSSPQKTNADGPSRISSMLTRSSSASAFFMIVFLYTFMIAPDSRMARRRASVSLTVRPQASTTQTALTPSRSALMFSIISMLRALGIT